MCIVMGADTAMNAQPAASPGRYVLYLATPSISNDNYLYTIVINYQDNLKLL